MTKPRTPVNLRDDGVLWAINRHMLHPQGLALSIDEDGAFHLNGDGSEPWSFAPETDDKCFADYTALLARHEGTPHTT